jgi:predicted RNA-binding protein with EMAP domain
MALRKIQNELLQIAERVDRRGKHDLAQKIRDTVEDLRWSGFNPKIALAFDLALESDPEASFHKILPDAASYSNLSVEELKNVPQIQEYFEHAKRVSKRRSERRELLGRFSDKL